MIARRCEEIAIRGKSLLRRSAPGYKLWPLPGHSLQTATLVSFPSTEKITPEFGLPFSPWMAQTLLRIMRLLAIGDIHGHTSALTALLDEICPSSTDKVVFLGDYVDKGPDVAGTLDLLSALSQKQDWIFLRGNHDQMMLDAYQDASTFAVWECLAGDDPLSSYGSGTTAELLRNVPDHHIRFLADRCCNFHETDFFIFVHAGIRAHMFPAEEEVDRLQWTVLSSAAAHTSGRTVVCGHSSQASGLIADYGHTICIDTGITKGKYLTCLNLDDYSYTQSSSDGSILKGFLPNRFPKH
jgi:serine/threonine protein phosphatase 1